MKTYGKMTRRSIRGSLSRFLSILSIIALGAGFLAGLISSTPDMQKTADNYFVSHNAYDYDITGTLGLTSKDIKAIGGLNEVDKVMLAGIGILFGIPVGIWLHKFVIRTVEVNSVMFGQNIEWPSYIYAAGLTILFTLFVNLIMRRKIKDIDMVESMKAND